MELRRRTTTTPSRTCAAVPVEVLSPTGERRGGGRGRRGGGDGVSASVAAPSLLPSSSPPSRPREGVGVRAPAVDPLDDPDRSALSSVQRMQYRRYVSGRGGPPGRRDMTPQARQFRVLEKLVREERAEYRSALQDFRERNAERFLIGFKGEHAARSGMGIRAVVRACEV